MKEAFNTHDSLEIIIINMYIFVNYNGLYLCMFL